MFSCGSLSNLPLCPPPRILLTPSLVPLSTDARVRLAVISGATVLDDTRDSLVRLLSPRLPRVAAIPASELTNASCSYSCLVLLRPAVTSVSTPGAQSQAEETTEAQMLAEAETQAGVAARQLDRRLPGYVIDVRVGCTERADPTSGDAVADKFHGVTGKWLCRVNCVGGLTDGAKRLAALLTAVLLSEEGAFHGQVLRL